MLAQPIRGHLPARHQVRHQARLQAPSVLDALLPCGLDACLHLNRSLHKDMSGRMSLASSLVLCCSHRQAKR
jgi:hypothetical protein